MSRSGKLLLRTAAGVAAAIAIMMLIGVVDRRLELRAVERYSEDKQDQVPAVERLGRMPTELPESSGLAVGRSGPDVLWSHNDSGDDPVLYRMDRQAGLTGVFPIRGARAVDWESMDIGPCPGFGAPEGELPADAEGPDAATGSPRASCLYVGDIGDNGRRRTEVSLYVVEEPDAERQGGALGLLGEVRLSYPDTAYDSEAIAVTPEGDVVLITKGRTPDIRLHTIPAEAIAETMGTPRTLTMPEGVRLPIEPNWNFGRVVTGAGLSLDGEVLAVRTYSEVYFFDWPIGEEPSAAAPPCFLGIMEPQGEAIAFQGDRRLLLTSETSERGRGMLLRVTCGGLADGDGD